MSDLCGNHIVGFPTRRLIFGKFTVILHNEGGRIIMNYVDSFKPGVLFMGHRQTV